MNGERHPSPPALERSRDGPDDLVRAIAEELALAAGRPDRVAERCARLRTALSEPPTPDQVGTLAELARWLERRGGEVTRPLFDLLVERLPSIEDPWSWIEPLLRARRRDRRIRVLEVATRLVHEGRLDCDPERFIRLAAWADDHPESASDPDVLAQLDRLASPAETRERDDDPVVERFLSDGPVATRRLAARLLDRRGTPAEAVSIGPVLMGTRHPAHLLQYGTSVEEIVNLVTVGVVEAAERRG